MGVNELKVVRKIEESMKVSRGPRIQVIKSRDLKNARSFAEKVYRVLRLHGYKIQVLNKDNIYQKVEKSNSDSITVYTIDEPTIKDALGDEINGTERPIRALFDRSMLSYMKAPVLIVVVSDEFYGETGLQSYAQSLSEKNGLPSKNRKKRPVRTIRNRATPVSLYLAAIAFMGSGLNSILGNYLVVNSPYGTILPLGLFILLVSIAAIVVRAISLGNETSQSMPLVVASIALFILLTLLGIFSSYLPLSLYQVINDTIGTMLTSLSPLYMLLAWGFFVLGLLRYILFLGRGSGTGAYALTIFGIIWLSFLVVMSYHPEIVAFGGLNPYATVPGGTMAYSSGNPFDFPIFSFDYYFVSNTVHQYLYLPNYLLLLGNAFMALSLLLAAKSQKALLGASRPK